MRRTPFRIENWAASNSALIDANVEQSENRRGARSTSGDDLEVRELHFERHRSSPHAGAVAVVPDLIDQPTKLSSHVEVPRERVLRSNRFADAIWENRPVIDASADAIEMPSRLPEMFLWWPWRSRAALRLGSSRGKRCVGTLWVLA
jgi:hypothetical protein